MVLPARSRRQGSDHSTFSVNRHGRFRDSDLLRHVFEAVVRACMLRTSPSQADYAKAEDFFDPEEWRSRASRFADAAKQKVEDWSAQASQAAREAKTQVAETAASMAERASDALHDAGDTARDRVTRLAGDATSFSDQASARLHAAMPDRDDRDNYLLGAAALAVAAAVGIAFQRRP
jgi:gas vesicle protein